MCQMFFVWGAYFNLQEYPELAVETLLGSTSLSSHRTDGSQGGHRPSHFPQITCIMPGPREPFRPCKCLVGEVAPALLAQQDLAEHQKGNGNCLPALGFVVKGQKP